MKAFYVSIPHSGEFIPPEVTWLQNQAETLVMCDVDRFVDQLYKPAIDELQIPNIIAQIHRYVIDLNRLENDVDASSVAAHQNPAGKFSRGLHWVITTKSQNLMPQPMSLELHESLVRKYFRPFHEKMNLQIQEFKKLGAQRIFHLDLHSMPSMGTSEHRDPGQRRADVVISDCEGKSCSPFLKDLVIESFGKESFSVAYNWPYMGGRITEMYGKPQEAHESIQIELNRSLYMNEETKKLNTQDLPEIQKRLKRVLLKIQEQLPQI